MKMVTETDWYKWHKNFRAEIAEEVRKTKN